MVLVETTRLSDWRCLVGAMARWGEFALGQMGVGELGREGIACASLAMRKATNAMRPCGRSQKIRDGTGSGFGVVFVLVRGVCGGQSKPGVCAPFPWTPTSLETTESAGENEWVRWLLQECDRPQQGREGEIEALCKNRPPREGHDYFSCL